AQRRRQCRVRLVRGDPCIRRRRDQHRGTRSQAPAPTRHFKTIAAYCTDYVKRQAANRSSGDDPGWRPSCTPGVMGKEGPTRLQGKGMTFIDAKLVTLDDGAGATTVALAMKTHRGWFVAEDGAELQQLDGPYRIHVNPQELTVRATTDTEEIV